MIRNIMKTAMTDNLAQNFSWAGRKSKRTFKDLGLSKIIIRKFFIFYKYFIFFNIILNSRDNYKLILEST